MKLTRLSAAPGGAGGAASCARGTVAGRTALQLIPGVRRTLRTTVCIGAARAVCCPRSVGGRNEAKLSQESIRASRNRCCWRRARGEAVKGQDPDQECLGLGRSDAGVVPLPSRERIRGGRPSG